MIFLTKLKQNLKFKILNIDNVSRLQKNILTLTIMQKKTIKCNQRDDDAIDVDHQNENYKNFKNNFKFKENKSNNKFERHNGDATTRDDDKFNNFRDNFICEKSKH